MSEKQLSVSVDRIDSAYIAGKLSKEEYAFELEKHGVYLDHIRNLKDSIAPNTIEINATQQKQYLGTVHVGVVGPDMESARARDSIDMIIRRSGDGPINRMRATKGYEARQQHINNFMATEHDFLLLLDSDMVFHKDTLERLRSHMVPYVSGYYMRRQINPISPVYFDKFEGRWPMSPCITTPDRDKLTEIGASGWGCILVHREVITAMSSVLKGEDEVIEDDMDVYPYDLEGMMKAINNLKEAKTITAAREHIDYLVSEFRPLRGKHDPVGSDIRFPFFAAQAGFQLVLDPEVRPAHIIDYGLTPDDFIDANAEMEDNAFDTYAKDVETQRKKNEALVKGLRNAR